MKKGRRSYVVDDRLFWLDAKLNGMNRQTKDTGK